MCVKSTLEYPQQSPYNPQYSQYGQQPSYQATAPYPVENEQYRQYPPQAAPQGYAQQQGYPEHQRYPQHQGYQQQGYQQHVAPPPYSETPITQQSMPDASGPPPVANQPASYQQNTSVTVGFVHPVSLFDVNLRLFQFIY